MNGSRAPNTPPTPLAFSVLALCLGSCQTARYASIEERAFAASFESSAATYEVPRRTSPAPPAQRRGPAAVLAWGSVATPAPLAATLPTEEAWRFSVAPYVWLLSVDGSATIGNQTVLVNEDFGDLLDQLSFVVEGRVEGWKGRTG